MKREKSSSTVERQSALEAALYASQQARPSEDRRAELGQRASRAEARALTLLILWDEYIADHPGYSRFCELYRAFEKSLSVTMRQTHAAGEGLFVDYAGDGVRVVIDRLTGEQAILAPS